MNDTRVKLLLDSLQIGAPFGMVGIGNNFTIGVGFDQDLLLQHANGRYYAAEGLSTKEQLADLARFTIERWKAFLAELENLPVEFNDE
jgi:hypothetical protein